MAEQLIQKYKPREYQLRALEHARQQNSIAFLDTGTGKTFIAFMLILETPGKTVFLAPSRGLVRQQMKAALDLGIKCQEFVGETFDNSTAAAWKQYYENNDLMLMTPQLFLNCLRAGYLHTYDFSLMVFDECHNARKNSPYLCIQREFYHFHEQKPKILGLTASPVVRGNLGKAAELNTNVLKEDLKELCLILNSQFCPIDRSQVALVSNKPKIVVQGYDTKVSNFENLLEMCVMHITNDDILQALEQNRNLYEELGTAAWKLYIMDLLEQRYPESMQRLCNEIRSQTSPQFRELIKILSDRFINSGQKRPKVIIFVERRITAWYLQCLLAADPTLNRMNINSTVIIGHSSAGSTIRMNQNRLNQNLLDFKQGDIDVLVATSVAEEGIDVPACDVVVVFQSVMNNLRSYVQSKGRARHQDSYYYILCPKQEKKKFEAKYMEYDVAIEWLKEMVDNSFQFDLTQQLPALDYYYVERTGAKISETYYENFLLTVCKALSNDRYTSYNYKIDYKRSGKKHYATGELPSILNIPKVITNLHQTMLGAQNEALRMMIEALHKHEYLDDHLKIAWRNQQEQQIIELELDEELEKIYDSNGKFLRLDMPELGCILPQHLIHPKANKEDQTSLYNQLQAFYLPSENSAHQFPIKSAYINIFYLNPTFTLFGKSNSIGILTFEPIQLSPFGVYPWNVTQHKHNPVCQEQHGPECIACNGWKYTAQCNVLELTEISRESYIKLKVFHIYLYSLILQNLNYLKQHIRSIKSEEVEVHSITIPCIEGEVDWDLIEQVYQHAFLVESDRLNPCYTVNTDYSHVIGKAVITLYNNHPYLAVKQEDFGIYSEFVSRGRLVTVKKFIKERYGLSISEQPVLVSRVIGHCRQALRPMVAAHQTYQNYFYMSHYPLLPPQFTAITPFDTQIVYLGKISCSFYYKLQQYYIVKHLAEEYGIDNELLLEAICMPAAQLDKNYERLEIIGDGILKILTSKYLFDKYPNHFEGFLSTKRVELTCNMYLFRAAIKKQLYKYAQVSLHASKGWHPPGFETLKLDLDGSVEEGSQDEKSSNSSATSQIKISNKQLADMVEAIIGAAYIDQGFPKAWSIMQQLDIITEEADKEAMPIHTESLQKFLPLEHKLGLNFPHHGWLEEAFMHANMQLKRNYQRLEFLGDAVLDVIVLEYLYNKYPDAQPGVLTQMKSIAVANKFFSVISYQLNLHEHLVFDSKDLKERLKSYSEIYNTLTDFSESQLGKLPAEPVKLMADIFESLFGAIYLTFGWEQAKTCALRLLQPHIDVYATPQQVKQHPKTRLLEFAQQYKIGDVKIDKRKLRQGNEELVEHNIKLNGKVIGTGVAPTIVPSLEIACNMAYEYLNHKLNI